MQTRIKKVPATSQAITDYIFAATKAWGGPQGFGQSLKEEFRAAKAGSHQRVRILDMMMSWLKISNDLRPKDALHDDLDDDELRQLLHEELSKPMKGDEPANIELDPDFPMDESDR